MTESIQPLAVEIKPRKRQWLRYTSIALVIGIVTLYFCFVFPNRSTWKTIQEIEKVSGKIEYEYVGPSWLTSRLSDKINIQLNFTTYD